MDSRHLLASRAATDSFDFVPFLDIHVISKRLSLALTVWMFYDLALSFSVTFVTHAQRQWSVGRIFFLLNKLVTPFMMLIHTLSLTLVDPNPSFCKIIPWTLTLGNGLVVICIAAALIARIHALWQKLWLLRALLAAFAVIFLGNFIFFAYFIIRSPPAAPTPFPEPFTGCAWFPMITSGWIPFLTSGAFETVCVVLTLWRTWSVENRRETPTRYLLFKDGVLYYIFIIAIKVFAVMSIFYPQISAFGAANGILAFSSMICSMLYTRLRSVANRPYGLSPYASPVPSYRTGSTDKVPQSGVVFSLTSESAWSSSESLKSYWANEKPLPPLPTHSRIISSLPRPKSTRVELLADRAGLGTNV